jgi:hypothetical protein
MTGCCRSICGTSSDSGLAAGAGSRVPGCGSRVWIGATGVLFVLRLSFVIVVLLVS